MRLLLLGAALLTLLLRPLAGAPVAYSGWPILTTLVMPVLVPLLFMLLMLDLMIASIWKSQSAGAELQRYRKIQLANLGVAAVLLLVWIPYYIALIG
jgi:predicted N-acetyltransferase YhbS